MKQAQGFLEKGNQIQVQVFLRGRQQGRPDTALELLREVAVTYLDDFGKAANQPSAQRLSITYNPVKR